MSIWEIILTVGVPLAAVIWGVNICHQRGAWFLAGWNTMREEKKAALDEGAMCRLYGKCVAGCGAGLFLLLWGSFCYYDGILCAGLGVIGLMVLLSALLPILNPGKYQKKNRD